MPTGHGRIGRALEGRGSAALEREGRAGHRCGVGNRRGLRRALPARGSGGGRRRRRRADARPRRTRRVPTAASFASARRARRGRGRRRSRARWSPSYGRIDVVVTAAGVAGGGPAHLVDRDEWQRVIDVNLTGTFLVCKHAIARMLEQEPINGERGCIVTIASVEGLEGTAGGSSYNASKGARRDLHEEHRDRLRHAGHPRQRDLPRVHRDADARGRVRHARAWRRFAPRSRDEHKLRRLGQPTEIAAVAVVPRSGPTRRSSPGRRSRSTAATRPAATTASRSCSGL